MITEKQLEKRKGYVGSSDMSAILGLDPFRTSYDIYLSKVKDLEPEASKVEHLSLGNEFEPIIIARAERVLGKILPNQFRSAKVRGLPFGTNIDGIVVETGIPVEAKCAGLFWPIQEKWGEPGTDEVPHRIIIQCHVHMICTGTTLCHVPVLQWGMKSALYQVDFDNDIANSIIERAVDFWENNVIANVPPEDSIPSLDMIKRIRREPASFTDVSDELVETFLEANQNRLASEKIEKSAKANLIAGLDDCEGGNCSMGTVTYLEQKQQRVDTAKVKVEMPGQFLKTIKFRKLMFKKNKG